MAEPVKDGKVLHFLKGLPDRYLLIITLLLMIAVYLRFPVDALLQVVINIVIAIIALSQKKSEPQGTNINTDSVNAGDISTSSMDITTDTINTKETE